MLRETEGKNFIVRRQLSLVADHIAEFAHALPRRFRPAGADTYGSLTRPNDLQRHFYGLFWISRCALLFEPMPFTLAHPAAAIPFRRTPLIMSAIVMGCLVPDFPHFLFLSTRVSFTHTVAGMFALDLPVALLMLWLFHTFLKQPMFLFLPSGMRRRLPTSVNPFPFWPIERLAWIVLSILTGASTHLLWDAFTHDDSWVYGKWTFLQGWVHLPVVGNMQMYNLLEYASSFVGALVIVIWICYWYRTAQPSDELVVQPLESACNRPVLAVLPLLALLGGALWSWHEHGIDLHIRPIVHLTADMLVAATTFFLIELFLFGVILRRNRPVPARSPV